MRRLDLTVLLVFVNLLRFRKATDVADHMGLTQSSISHSIKRLRDAFGDPLFLRTPKGMEPTAVALAIEPQIRTVIETLSEAMQKPFTFDPTIATDVIKIGAYDLEMTTLVPALLETIRTQAPNMRVSILPLGRRPAMEALEDQSIDIALGFAWDLPSKIHKVALFEERYCVVMRKGHPLARGDMELKTYLGAEHLIVSPNGDLSGIVDDELAKQGKTRHVAMAVPQFLPALSILATTDLIATLPSRLAASERKRFGLVTCIPPIKIRRFTVSAMLHERNKNSAMHEWVLGALLDIVAA